MDIGSKAKDLFNEISVGLLHLIGTPNRSKRDYQNNTIKPIHTACLTNNLMKPIPSAKPFLGFGIGEKDRPPIDMSNYAYHPGYVSSSDD